MIRPDQIRPYTDSYFTRARITCAHAGNNRRVLYQVFQRGDAVLCGIKYAMELLGPTGPEVEVEGLADGDCIAPLESVLHLHGPIQELVELETVCLGLLSRMTRVATNVRAVVEAANGKPVLFFPARFDAPEVQEYDGYAARIGGAAGASTPAGALAFHTPAVGTMPHALIAAFKGDTVAATLALAEATPERPIWSLVDFENDSARTAVEVYKALKERGLVLTGVRLDTAAALVDKAVEQTGHNLTGVNPVLVEIVRRRLDEAGGRDVKIAVSGGFNPEKIREFERAGARVDVYAVGENAFQGSTPFTSDVVGYYENGRLVHCAKVGREYLPNSRMKQLK
jgi:nicotinate phosphoribosyltransferase